MRNNQSPAANESPQLRKLPRKPALLAAAALIATGALGLTLGTGAPFAAAETAQSPQTIETPFGRAPLSFAHLVAKVSPAVVSINVKGEMKVADNNQMTGMPGMPDLPEDNPKKMFGFLEFSHRDQRVGDWVLAVRNPFGLGGTVTAGIISTDNRDNG